MRVSDVRTSVLAYFVGLDHLYCVVRSGANQDRVVRLGRFADFQPRLDVLFEAIEGLCSARRAEQIFTEFARGWGGSLLPGPELLDEADVLIVIPHSILHGVPLHAIEPRRDDRPLAVTHGVAYAPNGSQFVRCVERNPARDFDPAQWDFPRVDGSAAPPAPHSCWAAGVDVKFQSTPEYRRLADLFLASFAEKRSVSGERLAIVSALLESGDAAAFCIVCHGHYDAHFPMFSGLLFDSIPGAYREMHIPLHLGQNVRFRNLPFRFFPPEVAVRPDCRPEILNVSELTVMPSTSVELAALVGCSTAVGQASSGDDFLSLANQFLKMGAASVLASMWTLDLDFAASWLPKFLHAWLTLRMPKALAMREAMREELRVRPVPASQWAVPVLLGDWL